jgi:hypothetical protein
MLACDVTSYSLLGRYNLSDERTAPTFKFEGSEVRLRNIYSALFPLARKGIFSPPVNLSCNLTVPRFYLKHFHPADEIKNSFRALISGRIEMSHTEVGCVDMFNEMPELSQ